ncbi:hypothetical protein EVAR_98042_1 [Eumeta japonica]|uniref:Uncharacterized protein n=1 Tax=Eumeta variegata TaxID=151549 RepID=A0A4C1WBT0_EUMVA|nr:hypothetical protein EVAR_98042_1 [Eumeta japonica]
MAGESEVGHWKGGRRKSGSRRIARSLHGQDVIYSHVVCADTKNRRCHPDLDDISRTIPPGGPHRFSEAPLGHPSSIHPSSPLSITLIHKIDSSVYLDSFFQAIDPPQPFLSYYS